MPGKIKHFLWKACSNALPTNEILLKRRITTEDTCHQCSSLSESVLHTLWDCASLHQVWDMDFHWIDKNKASMGTFKNLVELIFEKPNMFELFAVIAWFLWSRRNKLRLNIDVLPLNRVVVEARRYLSLHKPTPLGLRQTSTVPCSMSQAKRVWV